MPPKKGKYKNKASNEGKERNPLEESLQRTQDSLVVLESKTKEMVNNLQCNMNLQLQQLQETIKGMLSTKENVADNIPHNDSQIESEGNIKQIQPIVKITGHFPLPGKLAENITFAQYTDWRRAFENYLIIQGLQNVSSLQVNAILLSLFDQDMLDVLRLVMKIDDSNKVNVVTILNELEKYFKKKENYRMRRSQFMSRKQEPGESFMSFYRQKLKLFQLTDPCVSCYETCIIDHVIESLYDSEVRKKCRLLPENASLDSLVKLCEAEEVATLEENTQMQLSKVNTVRKQQKNLTKICRRCNNNWHKSLLECPAKNTICNKCGFRGHFTHLCLKKEIKNVDQEEKHETSNIGHLSITSIDSIDRNWRDSTRHIEVTIEVQCYPKVYSFVYRATPDTGAEISVAGEDFLKQSQGFILKATNLKLQAANKSNIETIGVVYCKIILQGRFCYTKIVICKNVKELLLDKKTLIDLGIIHKKFPEPLPITFNVESLTEVPIREENAEILKNKLFEKYTDVFDTSTNLKAMDGKPVHIHLKEDAVPYAISCPRKIPYAWREEVKTELDDMVKKTIIKPVEGTPSDFVSPLVVVQKPNGKVRICVDYTMLNRYVKRPLHPFKAPWEAVSNIDRKSKYFSTLDATSGYWQLRLDEESQHLTTFLTPWGRYQFLRTPMGLVSSGDEFCRRGDEAFAGMSNIEKVVDDILLHDETFEDHYNKVVELLERCRKCKISLNPQKFVFAQNEVPYVGYIVGQNGIKADPKKVQAIRHFPRPKNLTELRSFMGLVNQLGNFSSEISCYATPLRSLMKKRNEFLWSSEHDNAFENIRTALVSPPILGHYDPLLETELHVDASRLNGLGYILLQKHDDKWKLVQCGSRFLSESESRYAMIEIELLAITWSVHKCKLYLLGLPNFKIITDHKPLIPILNNYTLDKIENCRIQRLKEKLSGFSFQAKWCKGKENIIPDALSRSPIAVSTENDLLAEDAIFLVKAVIAEQILNINNSDSIFFRPFFKKTSRCSK